MGKHLQVGRGLKAAKNEKAQGGGSLLAPVLYAVGLNSQLSTINSQLAHGTVFAAGSLQGPLPLSAPTARTRTHILVPMVNALEVDIAA